MPTTEDTFAGAKLITPRMQPYDILDYGHPAMAEPSLADYVAEADRLIARRHQIIERFEKNDSKLFYAEIRDYKREIKFIESIREAALSKIHDRYTFARMSIIMDQARAFEIIFGESTDPTNIPDAVITRLADVYAEMTK